MDALSRFSFHGYRYCQAFSLLVLFDARKELFDSLGPVIDLELFEHLATR